MAARIPDEMRRRGKNAPSEIHPPAASTVRSWTDPSRACPRLSSTPVAAAPSPSAWRRTFPGTGACVGPALVGSPRSGPWWAGTRKRQATAHVRRRRARVPPASTPASATCVAGHPRAQSAARAQAGRWRDRRRCSDDMPSRSTAIGYAARPRVDHKNCVAAAICRSPPHPR